MELSITTKFIHKMLQCPLQTYARLFYSLSSSLFLLFLFFYFTSIFLARLFIFIGGDPFYQRTHDEDEIDDAFSEEELGGEFEFCSEKGVGVEYFEETSYGTPPASASEDDEVAEEVEVVLYDSKTNVNGVVPGCEIHEVVDGKREEVLAPVPENQHRLKSSFRRDEGFLVFPSEDQVLDSFTLGSTSKDSSEWRSSINCRDSGTDDPFSSSSRRSCPKWESYTLFQKYDEEMLFLDRISAQKLHETESLRSIAACPRSISERIVYTMTARRKKLNEYQHNAFHELESAYVAQICLTWEALNWNYKYFQRLRASRKEFDPGCPAYVAQQFQQFQVLLQRYIENEPYDHGRRPDIYARIRSLAPKLLQVPEYRDTDDGTREEGHFSRIPSNSFLDILEESIRVFMRFLRQDKRSHSRILADLFRRSRRGSLLLLLEKLNKKKKAKLKELHRSGKCLRRRKLNKEEEIEVLMASIDLKVVSRVLRMRELNNEQLQWCENKMSKVRVSDGKLHRDSAPLFFPAH